ncbi:hypothetical protein ACGFZP_30955 [Kitasatospora sp. NPDC048239]|uniref:vWA-MoxR associated conflict system protein n=1 Tax=Kitasatospora sp. NPDC048239 TaxID=3364046 RepID=UPI003715F70C
MSDAWQPPTRHLLLIATQCAAMPDLDGLETVADRLFDVLTDPGVGGCEPSPVADPAHLRSGTVTWREAEDAVLAAVRAAGEAGATLVLALLGHGQTPASGGPLWYMAADSLPDAADRSLDVSALLDRATDHPGVAGVIALVDTCHAATGVPGTAALAGGFRNGRKRLAALLASGVQQEAFRLDFSRTLTALLGEGLPGEGDYLLPGALKLKIAPELTDQDVHAVGYDGDADADGPLWLALNRRRHAWKPSAAIGSIGAEDLARALRARPADPTDGPTALGGPTAPGGWTRQALLGLSAQGRGPTAPPAARWAGEVADGVVAAMDTGGLLVELAGPALTTPLLRRLAAEFNRQWAAGGTPPVRPPGSLTGRPLLQHLLEHAALRAPSASDGSPHLALAWYVVAMAEACHYDLSDARVQRWARDTGDPIGLNTVRETYRRQRRERALRLVVSLHAAQVDWPDSLSACLRDGPDCLHHRHFPCQPDQSGVEQALPEVVDWAERLLPPGSLVQHVDIVAAAPVLLDWHPERTRVGILRLGVNATVTLRWAGRLVVPARLRGMNEHARALLEKMEQQPLDQCAPVDWVDPADSGAEQLAEALLSGAYQRAVGIGRRPPQLQDLVTAFLPYTPILFWPCADADHGTDLAEEGRACLTHLWESLPEGLGDAYRRRWHGRSDRDPVTDGHLTRLADLRSAWHDHDWLDFCTRYDQHAPAAPRST